MNDACVQREKEDNGDNLCMTTIGQVGGNDHIRGGLTMKGGSQSQASKKGGKGKKKGGCC